MKVKPLIVSLGAFALLSSSLCSCGLSKAEKEEAARQDSIRVADSIANAEEEMRLAAIETAKQDSLAKIEKFKQSLPDLSALYRSFSGTDEVDLEKLGFTKTTKKENLEEFGIELVKDVYKLELDPEHYCIITFEGGYEATHCSLTVVGFPDILEDYKTAAKALKNSSTFTKYGVNPYMEIKKDKICWEDGV